MKNTIVMYNKYVYCKNFAEKSNNERKARVCVPYTRFWTAFSCTLIGKYAWTFRYLEISNIVSRMYLNIYITSV